MKNSACVKYTRFEENSLFTILVKDLQLFDQKYSLKKLYANLCFYFILMYSQFFEQKTRLFKTVLFKEEYHLNLKVFFTFLNMLI